MATANSGGDRQRPFGVLIFGFLMLVSSAMHIYTLIADVHWYARIHSYLPADLIVARYAVSWVLRGVGILLAVGILAMKEVARKALIVFGWASILTAYWKNPFAAEKIQCEILQKEYGNPLAAFGISDAAALVAPYVTALICLEHIVFYGIAIYYFTRPSVKRHFSRERTARQPVSKT